MVKNKVINIAEYKELKELKERNKLQGSIDLQDTQNHSEEEERIKTLDLFMKVIATMYKESYK